MILAEIVEWQELGETVVASVVAGVGVTAAFALAIWGVGRFSDHSRAQRPLAASASIGIASAALAFVAAAVVFGIIVMTNK